MALRSATPRRYPLKRYETSETLGVALKVCVICVIVWDSDIVWGSVRYDVITV